MDDKQIASAYIEGLISDLEDAGFEPAPERPPGFGITIMEYAQAKSCADGISRKTLTDAVKSGVLVSHKMRLGDGGAYPLVFCRPNEWPPKV